MKKILVIEDDRQLQEIYKKKLTDRGYKVFQALDGNTGMKKAQTEKPDLIILDIMLPGGPDGFIVLDKLKSEQATKNIKIIVATNIENQAVKAIETGVVWYFVKAQTPIKEVVEKIDSLLQ